ncbi:MAG: hypothetical protein PWP27_1782 [Clostridiales bacterium]|jgi:hypothetical protein|nr:hypothetical protein [Clostridiales bacterium]MDK2933972.1 hypothetical protein [Clostridiales bacterium]
MFKSILKIFVVFICTAFIFNTIIVSAVDQPTGDTYTGVEKAVDILKRIEFTDIEALGPDYWARDAIYDMAALSIIKGKEKKTFDGSAPVTRIQALALIYRAIGKETEAKQAAAIVEQMRQQNDKKINSAEVWADGYLQLAVKDGLITQQQFDDALAYDQTALNPQKDFIKNAPAQRQEIGEWMAKALGLTPVYTQQNILSGFHDYKAVDPSKTPYLEAVLKEKIMKGNHNFLYPQDNILREQMAQVLKNAEKFILSKQAFTKKYGYIESITETSKREKGQMIKTTLIKIRNAEEKIDYVLTQRIYALPDNILDTSQDLAAIHQKEIIVRKEGVYGSSELLEENDVIEYIVDQNHQIKVVRVVAPEKRAEQPVKSLSISSIYKANIYVYDAYDSDLILNNLKKFENGQWVLTDTNGYTALKVKQDTAVYTGNTRISVQDINKYYTDSEAYIAVGRENDGVERAIYIIIRDMEDVEKLYTGSLRPMSAATFKLRKQNITFRYGDSAIIIKDGQAIGRDKLATDDKIYMVANWRHHAEEFAADIILVQTEEPAKDINQQKKWKK